ncbi:MAG: histone deacetylase family protein [Alphaproteobacteria bacterium]
MILYSHPACAEHDMGFGHPEQPARLAAVLKALDAPEFAALDRREAPQVDPERLTLMHPQSYVDRLMGLFPKQGRIQIDADTAVNEGSKEAALRAAGALIAAVDAVMTGESNRAFCAVRPPGHHAEPDQSMGFCLFNNVAIGAGHARDAHGLSRVAVVDFDVHHGNGTQAMFQLQPDLMFASTHQMPLYPGTGAATEQGIAKNIVNAPLPPHAGSAEFRRAYRDIVLPRLRAFAPELILISAGFDAHRDDPLAQMELVEDDYDWVTREIVAVADECCDGRIVSTLEGGYDLVALGRSTAAHVKAMMS